MPLLNGAEICSRKYWDFPRCSLVFKTSFSKCFDSWHVVMVIISEFTDN